MRKCVITSVGTSLITNTARTTSTKNPTKADILKELKKDSTNASAEMNVLNKLGLEVGDEVTLIHTESDNGILAAKCLQEFLKQDRDIEAKLINPKKLTDQSHSMVDQGLFQLAADIVEEIDLRKKTFEVMINMNGGFKPQCGVMMIVGALMGIPVYYTHESHHGLVKVPPLPITWDEDFFAEHEELLQQLQPGNMTVAEFDHEVKNWDQPTRIQLKNLTYELEENVTLSPLVEAAFERYLASALASDHVQIRFSKVANDKLQALGENRRIRTLIEQVSRKPSPTKLKTKENSDLYFAGKGHTSERVAIYFESNFIVIADLWPIHDDYEQALQTRTVLKENYPPVAEYERTN